MHQTEGQVKIKAGGEHAVVCPDSKIIFLHQLARGNGDLSASRNHPRNDTDSGREYYGALGCHLPEFAGKYFIFQRQNKGKRDHVGGMCMVHNAVSFVLKFFYLQVHQMARKLWGRTSSVDETPDDAVIFTFFIQLNHTDAVFRFDCDISEIFSASGYQEILSRKIWNGGSDRIPLSGLKIFFYLFNLFRFHTVRKVSAVSLMPSLLPAIICHTDKAFYKFCI